MKHVRFRDPAGAVRRGKYQDGIVHFANESYDKESDEIDVLPPCEPSKIVCIGRNYADHADEMDSTVPDQPLLFLKPPSALAGHGDTVTVPAGKDRIDYEAELAVVIGEQCRHVPEDDAMDAVEGITCMNDISNRDDQRQEKNWVRGKAFDGAAPLGPVLATPDEVPDDAAVRSRVNGDLKQDGTRDQLIFPIPELIAEITTYLTLEPGDIIATGTPEGVGPLADGDEIEIEVEGVGTLEHTVCIP
ncbi:fumarylacetoacetate hydrolase family protein [Natronobacterium gregoryi]|uniref:2-keto-4-pentenoate hydratase/2-oxohepta-3-ene-1,7-dioic acid hydratase n=2 Tax=Natronobacterium gregoryi TaxID=44930 RepID=L0ALY0_NATGS|nr:fumarylacetoacetate hydrolase family protein [Natronobacterium gregoryi]AFZ74801.1 2-keto-4-pentenoate hydratase/2-oxohepta-3-ene-1,7-dioic acid hydratase [Natronobacterium gregoryi SP2]ELY66133.1 5-carboxymethyl-2-hydroxymuconate delta-isomerase [Natronobacterium gregoryi SP2]PLK19492.1 FAA hydrolase family protein [Natronobacterium gregoryi SP2]SFJ43396.1 2-keto-4-pentenoate hydratase/2-oxohepta-3-ene-1,7-dioic acid hydratase (catechol pathway) [Natronobacterium gregoryi]